MGCVGAEQNKCCGCGACAAVCPVKAITMETDELGYLYPFVHSEKCIDCGKCTDVCQIDQSIKYQTAEQLYYAGQHRDTKTRMESSSGGIFFALAQAVIQEGGTVYGAAFDGQWQVRHMAAATLDEVKPMRGSKYIQSDTCEVYEELVKVLDKGKPVLYSGTPCQCQGVLQYINKRNVDDSRLYLMDFVCHGVGSPKIWDKYINWLSENKGNVHFVTFRDKENGWEKVQPCIRDNNGKNILKGTYSYFDMYRSLLTTRDSCFTCDFASYERCADITLGDFWNIGKLENEFDIYSGVSQILVNTVKGKTLLEKISSQVLLLPCSREACWQPHLEYPAEKPPRRDKFLTYYREKSFDQVLKRYGKGTFLGLCKKKLVPIVKKLGLYTLAGKMYNAIFGKNGRKH